jgi:hypothetical protein
LGEAETEIGKTMEEENQERMSFAAAEDSPLGMKPFRSLVLLGAILLVVICIWTISRSPSILWAVGMVSLTVFLVVFFLLGIGIAKLPNSAFGKMPWWVCLVLEGLALAFLSILCLLTQ